jgi:hypothetical protein
MRTKLAAVTSERRECIQGGGRSSCFVESTKPCVPAEARAIQRREHDAIHSSLSLELAAMEHSCLAR